MKTLYTERLILRDWMMNDAEDLYEYARSPVVGPAAGWQPHASFQVSLEYLEHTIESGDTYAIVYKENNKVIGSLGLHKDRLRCQSVASRTIGYVLGEEYWGKGLMTEAVREVMRYAFTELGMQILSVQHFPENERSRRVIKKCGFVYEGTIRMDALRADGSACNACTYSITAVEWEAGENREKKHYRFYQNRNCEYFPCHKTDKPDAFSCQFCYCPLYLLGTKCGGNFKLLPGGIKDCSDCLIPHHDYDHVVDTLEKQVYQTCGG